MTSRQRLLSLLPTPSGQRDRVLMNLEAQVRVTVRDAVNWKSRRPFFWGGSKGYEQLEAIAQVLRSVPSDEPGTGYLRYLGVRVERVVERNRVMAQDLQEAHTWLRRIAECLRYPPSSFSTTGTSQAPLTSEQIRREMEELLQSFQPDLKRRPAQAALHGAWHRLWEDSGAVSRYLMNNTAYPFPICSDVLSISSTIHDGATFWVNILLAHKVPVKRESLNSTPIATPLASGL